MTVASRRLALMLLTHARREARATAAGDLVPLAEQDRAKWDRALIEEGTGLAKASLAGPALGPYQLQAAIAATHADAATPQQTNWRQVHALYLILERIAPNPMVTLNRAIALAETEGPLAGLALLSSLEGDERMAGTIGCCRCGRTCWRRPATRPGRTSTTGAPRRRPPASPSGATWSPGPAG
jgi:predicted RNA polymerase sigma factor